MQLDRDYKGFSFLREGPLDMRMNPLDELSAKDIVNTWSEKKLGELFRDVGEDPRWKAAARVIVEERKKRPFTTTTQLAGALVDALKTKIRGRLHPATLVFQALRVFVNKEIEVLEKTLAKVVPFLAPKGVVGVMSFQSFEDRIVKTMFKEAAKPLKEKGAKILPALEILTKKPLVASWKEVRDNPRARSAKLRFAQKH